MALEPTFTVFLPIEVYDLQMVRRYQNIWLSETVMSVVSLSDHYYLHQSFGSPSPYTRLVEQETSNQRDW